MPARSKTAAIILPFLQWKDQEGGDRQRERKTERKKDREKDREKEIKGREGLKRWKMPEGNMLMPGTRIRLGQYLVR